MPSNRLKTIAFALTMIAGIAGDSVAQPVYAPAPPYAMRRAQPSYAGDCGPNPPPGYRYDLRNWRSGFNRDFYCYMLDEY